MIITFFRSSSFNTYGMCPFQYYLEYNLGMRTPGNFSADKGSVVHKALEILAGRKLAEQENKNSFDDEELGLTFPISIPPDEAFDHAYHYYSTTTPHEWNKKSEKECRKWMYDAMAYNDGLFNPLKRTIARPEQYFEFLVEKPWAKYHYKLPDGNHIEGYLGLKGTIDLVCHVNDDVIELVDWKTGARKDWSNGDVKDWDKLRRDSQLRMYHWALARLYPHVKQIIITIVFIKDGGPFSMCFDETDLEETEKMLRKRFDEIRECSFPFRVKGTRREMVKTWGRPISKCEKFCHFGKTLQPGTNETICDFMHGELKRKGMNKVLEQYGDLKALSEYGSGGGMTNRTKENVDAV